MFRFLVVKSRAGDEWFRFQITLEQKKASKFDAILFLVPFQNGWDCRQTILTPNHSKSKLKKVQILNLFCILMVHIGMITVLTANYSGDLKSYPETFEIRLLEFQILYGPVFKWFSYGFINIPNHLKTRPFKIQIKQTGYQVVNSRWWPVVKCLGVHISDPIQNPDHLQTNPFLTILKFIF